MRTGTVIVATLLLARIASGQPNPDPTDPIYHVEVILFAYNDGSRTEEDLHHDDGDREGPIPQLLTLPPIELESIFDLPVAASDGIGDDGAETGVTNNGLVTNPSDSIQTPAGDSLELFETAADRANRAANQPPPGFRPLGRSELVLTAERRELDRLSAYTVLGHAGWALAGVDSERAMPLDLQRVGIVNPRGTIEVYLSRYLHTSIDLEFFEGSGTLWRPADGFGLAPFEHAESYRLTDDIEAMRSGELHHADHPLYGVLIQIVPAPEPAEGEDGAGRPAG